VTVGGWKLFLQAFVSEFLGWAGVILLPLVYRNKRVILGLVMVGSYVIMPGDARTVVSNFRYLIPGFMVLIVAAFEWAKTKKKDEWLGSLVVINMAAVLPQLEYYPKLMLIILAGYALWTGKRHD
jgi:hypothetical protein